MQQEPKEPKELKDQKVTQVQLDHKEPKEPKDLKVIQVAQEQLVKKVQLVLKELKEPKDHEWERFQRQVISRLEHRLSWGLIASGGLLVLGLGLYAVFSRSALSLPMKSGLGALLTGFVLLFLHVLRGRIRTLPYDRYREVQR